MDQEQVLNDACIHEIINGLAVAAEHYILISPVAVAVLAGKVESLEDENEFLNNSLLDAEDVNIALEEYVDTLHNDSASLEAHVDELCDDIESLEETVEDLETETDYLNKVIDEQNEIIDGSELEASNALDEDADFLNGMDEDVNTGFYDSEFDTYENPEMTFSTFAPARKCPLRNPVVLFSIAAALAAAVTVLAVRKHNTFNELYY